MNPWGSRRLTCTLTRSTLSCTLSSTATFMQPSHALSNRSSSAHFANGKTLGSYTHWLRIRAHLRKGGAHHTTQSSTHSLIHLNHWHWRKKVYADARYRFTNSVLQLSSVYNITSSPCSKISDDKSAFCVLSKNTKGGWICVFVCMTTSAVHLGLVTDYSTEGFIATYRRFSSRRGIPHTIYSDCGTNFVGADANLQSMFTQGSQQHQQLASLFVNDNTTWCFNPPAAPHMGGKWEEVVKSIKYHLRRTVRETVLTYEEFRTLLTQIEVMLNSRPLEPLSDDPEDISTLTPAHFLIGKSLTTLSEPSVEHTSLSPSARWQLIQKMQQFWSQWSAHYLQRQQSISKWHHPSNDIKVGSLVLITDERFLPSKWPLARVLTLHPGKDGLTRVVTFLYDLPFSVPSVHSSCKQPFFYQR